MITPVVAPVIPTEEPYSPDVPFRGELASVLERFGIVCAPDRGKATRYRHRLKMSIF
jgi:hypothetical protein